MLIIPEFKNEIELREYLKNFELPKHLWHEYSYRIILSEQFIRENQGLLNWSFVSKNQVLSESFIREFKEFVNWFFISKYQKLTESFVEEFKDRIDWQNISLCQCLTIEFMDRYSKKIYWKEVLRNKTIPESIKEIIRSRNLKNERK